jgi:superfamily II DNA or RNA helicase
MKNDIVLRSWQESAFKSLKGNEYSGILAVVTGGGKTIFGLHCYNEAIKERPDIKLIVVVPSQALRDQWAVNISKYTTIKSNEIGFSLKNPKKICYVVINLSFQKQYALIETSNCLVIFDECHRYGTINNIPFLSRKYFGKVGLTATLERLYDDGVESILKRFIGDLIYEYNINDAVNDGVVTPFKLINYKLPLIDSEEHEINKINRSISIAKREENEEKIKFLLLKRRRILNNSMYRVPTAVMLIKKHLMLKKIVFCESTLQADEIYLELKRLNLQVAIYHSKLSQKKRLSNLVSFINGYCHTLIGCKSLDEGFDVPDIEMAIIVSQTATNRQRIQRIGRSIRKSPNKESSVVITLYNSEDEERKLDLELDDQELISKEWYYVNKMENSAI